ncbi:MAG: hypothetical protein IKC37_05095 [Clostridia bacterium]|nr:hypothetical protein [Clostridia bacterium]
MSDELLNDLAEDLDLGDMAAEFAEMTNKEEETFTEDLEGFAKGFPSWDLHPPKKK